MNNIDFDNSANTSIEGTQSLEYSESIFEVANLNSVLELTEKSASEKVNDRRRSFGGPNQPSIGSPIGSPRATHKRKVNYKRNKYRTPSRRPTKHHCSISSVKNPNCVFSPELNSLSEKIKSKEKPEESQQRLLSSNRNYYKYKIHKIKQELLSMAECSFTPKLSKPPKAVKLSET